MIRFDFDVVSDPLPPKPIRPPAAEVQAAAERRQGEDQIPGDGEAAKGDARGGLGKGP
jgi:hypothetical protein